MSNPIEFSDTPLHMSEKQYLQALRDLGVGEQEAQFMLGFRNGTVSGDAFLPDAEAQAGKASTAIPAKPPEPATVKGSAQAQRSQTYLAEAREDRDEQPSSISLGGKYATAGRKR